MVWDMQLATALEEAKDALEQAQVERERLNAVIVDLEAEIHGLTLSVARREGKPPPDPTELDAESPAWATMPRTDAIVDALLEADSPTGPAGIAKLLISHGRTDDRAAVAASLNYLKSKDRVHSQGYGKWVAGPSPKLDETVHGTIIFEGAP